MILLVSLTLDAGLLITELSKRSGKLKICRLMAMSAIINMSAFYVSAGLAGEFGDSVFLKAAGMASAKIFIVWSFLQKKRPTADLLPVYLLSIAVSACIHSDPMTGLLCELFLLSCLLYSEKMDSKEHMHEKEKTASVPPEENRLYLQTIEDSYRKNRALMHDLNNHAIAMHALAVNGEYEELVQYIDTFSQKVKDNMFPVHTGNLVLDALLADKYHRASKRNIPVLFEKVQYSADIRNEDLCIVVGSLFDNAIEENEKCRNAAQRKISICILSEEHSLSITVKNPLFHEMKIKNGLPASDKLDVEHHGMGLKNVRRICDQYQGTLTWNISEQKFSITASLYTS